MTTLLHNAAERYPEQEALIEGEVRFSYGAWASRVHSVARGLYASGIRPGDRVVLCTRNSEAAATSVFALLSIGAIAVPLSTRWKGAQLAYAIEDSQAQAVIYDAGNRVEVDEALKAVSRPLQRLYIGDDRSETAINFAELATYPPILPGIRVNSDAVATILYTSGTSGTPKGVLRTHRSDYAGIGAMLLAHGWTWFERTVAVMPIYHVMGLHTLFAMVAVNGRVVLEPRFDPARITSAIRQERLTTLYLVPTAYHDLVAYIEQSRCELPPVEKLAYAGAPMSRALAQRCIAAFRPRLFVNHYGCTEMQIISANRSVITKPEAAGKPALNTRIRLVEPDRSRRVAPDRTVPPGTVGEIIVDASVQAFSGYLNRPDDTERAVRDGWYYTGDLGVIDAEGDLTVVGRVDDMIVSGGENIHATEVEAALLEHPGVRDAAVVGLPDERWGQVVTAFIVPASPEVSSDEIDRFCARHGELARFKRPRRYVFVESIPRSPTGKLLRSVLREGVYTPVERNGSASN